MPLTERVVICFFWRWRWAFRARKCFFVCSVLVAGQSKVHNNVTVESAAIHFNVFHFLLATKVRYSCPRMQHGGSQCTTSSNLTRPRLMSERLKAESCVAPADADLGDYTFQKTRSSGRSSSTAGSMSYTTIRRHLRHLRSSAISHASRGSIGENATPITIVSTKTAREQVPLALI